MWALHNASSIFTMEREIKDKNVMCVKKSDKI